MLSFPARTRLLPVLLAVALLSAVPASASRAFGRAQAACVPVLSATWSGAVYGAGSCTGGGAAV